MKVKELREILMNMSPDIEVVVTDECQELRAIKEICFAPEVNKIIIFDERYYDNES